MVPLVCTFCELEVENNWHMFCFAQSCWHESNLEQVASRCSNDAISFNEWLFLMLSSLHGFEQGKFSMVLWNVWRQRNEKVWNNTHKNIVTTVSLATKYLCDWLATKHLSNAEINNKEPWSGCLKWHRPPSSFVKCNVDAAFFLQANDMGLGIIVWDDKGNVLVYHSSVIPGCASIREGEALGLLDAIPWVWTLGFSKIIFELGAKVVVKAVQSSCLNISEFGSLIQRCREILHLESNFSICFVWRQANESAHALARACCSYASPTIWWTSPDCLDILLSLMCTNLNHF